MKRNIDLNLLACLDALLTERSVTRAALRLGMSQPGMSNALARLRQLTGDTLLVRSGNELVPTQRALTLSIQVRSGLAALEEIFADERPLEPGSAVGTVTIAAADSVGVMLTPLLMQALAENAPYITVNVRLPDPEKLHEWLAEDECDIAFGHFPNLPVDLHSTNLFSQSLSCIANAALPFAHEALTLEGYLARRHIAFGSPFSPHSTLEATIDGALEKLGQRRERAAQLASVLQIPYVVAGSPHIATLPTWLAQHFAGFLPLRVLPLPFTTPLIECRMVWHERTHRLGLQRWFRQLARSTAQDIAETRGAASIVRTATGISFADGPI